MSDDFPIAVAIREGQPILVPNRADLVERFPRIAELGSQIGTEGLAVFPLAANGHDFGAWALCWTDARTFEEGELIILLTLASQCAQALERATLYERERFISTALQRTLLPHRLPTIPGATTAHRYRPSAAGVEVGGDWYDVIHLPGQRVVLVIGDVGGHNIDAAAVMGQLRNAVRSYAWQGQPASKVMDATNRLLCGLEPGVLATCCIVELGLDDGIASVALAGHPPPLVLCPADDKAHFMDIPADPPLGTSPDHAYEQSNLFLSTNDAIVLYTDGLTESRAMSVSTGMQRLLEAGLEVSGSDAERVAAHLMSTSDAYAREDDRALLVLRYEPLVSDGNDNRTVTRSLPTGAASAVVARRLAADVMRGWGAREMIEPVSLCVSELVTNALVHTVAEVELSLSIDDGNVRIEVHDESEHLPVFRDMPAVNDTSGRGLMIVDATASAWGVETREVGKSVWCEISRIAT